jgi:hypothetical protein
MEMGPSGRSVVSVVQTSDTAERNDSTMGSRPGPPSRAFLTKPEMSTIVVIVGDVIREESLQVASVSGIT